MGYLQELEQELHQLLADLPEGTQKEITTFVVKKVYGSWKSGVEHGQASARLASAENGLAQAGKRLFKKQRGA